VDRFGQEKDEVRVITYYGSDNPIDGVILDVLIRKHKSIKSALGVTVAVPGSSERIAEALFEGALFRERTRAGSPQMSLAFIDDLEPKKERLHSDWQSACEREETSRRTTSRFAQQTLSPEAVGAELQKIRAAIGRSEDVARFFHAVMKAATVPVQVDGKAISVHLTNEISRALRQAMGRDDSFKGRFDLPVHEGELYLGRTSPIIEGLAGWVLDQALGSVDVDGQALGSRCGVISTSAVTVRTTLMIARFRYHLKPAGADADTILCEEIVPLACQGSSATPQWRSAEESEALLDASPERNLVRTAIDQQLDLLLPSLPDFQRGLEAVAYERAADQLVNHERVREASRTRGRVTIEPVLPVDILGAYILLPRLN
jgi:hypothetical protein